MLNLGAVIVDRAQQQWRLALIGIGGLAAGIILAASITSAHDFYAGNFMSGQDAHAYWGAVRTTMPYGEHAGAYGAYLYSPAFIQILQPVLALSWTQFLGLWTMMLIGVLLVLTGPVLFALVMPIVFFELWGGNIHLLLALTIVLGFRYPAVWGFALLTKVTPGVGLLWFAARREWRALAIATGVTAAVVAVSWLMDPTAWMAWIDMLIRAPGGPPAPGIHQHLPGHPHSDRGPGDRLCGTHRPTLACARRRVHSASCSVVGQPDRPRCRGRPAA